ncbi:acyltransferase [Acinetobacter sp. YH16038]|uniref:acyltransferase family protein n=1 Tax=Acinetobacter sp. YH16038 TaxID=2601183 RepID=UPI00211E7AB8|nr:acyltransferase [Acinetobacter sp. YH16038]
MLYSVQFLRGIAALMVVISHTSFKGQQYNVDTLQWYHIGGSGVDLFFIISGFIMCYTTYNKKVNFLNFMRNRFIRIIPLYWVLSFFALIVFLISPNLINSSGGETGIFESFFLIPNGSKFLINNGWTLSYEFYYYFIFSFFLIFLLKDLYKYLFIILYFSVVVAIGLILQPKSEFLMFLTHNLLLEFALGVLAFIIIKNTSLSRLMSIFMILVGASLLAYQNFYKLPDFITLRSLKIGLPMFFIFVGCVALEDLITETKSLILRFFNHLGDSSYSLYLIHPFTLSPVAMVLNKLNILNPYLFSSILITSSILAGSITYLVLEKRLIKLGKEPFNFFRYFYPVDRKNL